MLRTKVYTCMAKVACIDVLNMSSLADISKAGDRIRTGTFNRHGTESSHASRRRLARSEHYQCC